jgi:hypothetical protein
MSWAERNGVVLTLVVLMIVAPMVVVVPVVLQLSRRQQRRTARQYRIRGQEPTPPLTGLRM